MTLQLENYGVSELSHSEQQETDGGFLPLLVIGVALLLSACTGNGNNVVVGGSNNKQSSSSDSAKASSDSTSANLNVTVPIKLK